MKRFLIFTKKEQEKELIKKTGVLSTLSSGQDSIVTFFILLHIKTNFLVEWETLYCHHFWQPKNFFSIRLLFALNFLFEIPYTVTLPQRPVVNENKSRNWRKKNFFRVGKLLNLVILTTGQTVTDILEKFFNNLFRGTTPKGLINSNFFNSKMYHDTFFSPLILKLIHSEYRDECPYRKKLNFNNNKNLKFLNNTLCILKKDKKQIKTKKLQFKTSFYFKTRKTYLSSREKTKAYLGTLCTGNSKPVCCFFARLRLNRIKKKYLTVIKKKKIDSMTYCFYTKTVNLKLLYKKPLLSSISVNNHIKQLRQTLSRFTVSKLVKHYNFPVVTDITNFSLTFSRNKIRSTIFPLFRYIFHSRFESLINNFLKSLELEKNSMEDEIQKFVILVRVSEVLFLAKGEKDLLSKNTNMNMEREQKIYKTREIKNQLFLQQPLFLQQLFVKYSNLDLSHSQTCILDQFVQKNYFIIGLPGTRTRN